MATPEQTRLPELPSQQSLDKAFRQLNGDFYVRHIESATQQWLLSQGAGDRSRYEVILFQADALGGMLHHVPEEARVSDEHSYNAGFVAAREGILAGLMLSEQWLGLRIDMRDVLNKLVADSVTMWERRAEFRSHVTSALLARAVEGLDLQSTAQLSRVKVWERDLAKDHEVEPTEMFSLGLGLALVESKHHFDYVRAGLMATQGREEMRTSDASSD